MYVEYINNMKYLPKRSKCVRGQGSPWIVIIQTKQKQKLQLEIDSHFTVSFYELKGHLLFTQETIYLGDDISKQLHFLWLLFPISLILNFAFCFYWKIVQRENK